MSKAVVNRFFNRLGRTKNLEAEIKANNKSKLARCLTAFDLTTLGVGSTLGLGLYVLTGHVAAQYAGPAVVISWVIAAAASAFSGLCYAEFGARVPSAGSAYAYSYVTVGEFMAFIIGWNMILEYVIVMLAVGVSESTKFNNVCTVFNVVIVFYVVICGAFKANTYNWNIPKADIPYGVPREGGNGGFMPFGFAGIMAGAAKCFFGFVGFDIVATTGEEVKNPKRAIPLSFVLSLIIIFIAYVSVATIQTLMQPYYIQDNGYALPFVFEQSGYPVARWIISIGALAGLSTSLLGAMFPLPRVVYSMAKDGVVYRWLGYINSKTKTPVIATAIGGFLAAFMACMFNLEELVDMMSIGTLMAYTLVSASVLLLRYRYDENDIESAQKYPIQAYIVQAFKYSKNDSSNSPTIISSRLSSKLVLGVGIFGLCAALIPGLFLNYLKNGAWWAVLIVAVFSVPLVPLIPSVGIFVNIYLMLSLSPETWVRFAVWMAVGFLIYFSYGIFNSSEEYIRKGLVPPNQRGENDNQVSTESTVINTQKTSGGKVQPELGEFSKM
ncbi:Cationic amino acid transporter 2 [Nymphon striatum]|nr:Cationic amino acid transporter 2 [Nymphon striatum]